MFNNFNVSALESQASPKEFFNGLSAKDPFLLMPFGFRGYEKDFRIRQVMKGTEIDYQIFERAIPWKINPLGWFIKSVPVEERVATAKLLTDLFNKYASKIAQDPSCHVGNITKALARYKNRFVIGADKGQAVEITTFFNRAIHRLQTEHAKVQEENFKLGLGEFEGKTITPHRFYQKLTSNSFLFGLRWPLGLHQQFHIIKRAPHRYEVRLLPKRWFFQKWFSWPTELTTWHLYKNFAAKPVRPETKVVTAQMIEEMIKDHVETIEYMELNTDKMITNLQTIRDKMVRNTSSFDAIKIKKAFDSAIVELTKCGAIIRIQQQNSWKRWAFTSILEAAKLPYYLGKDLFERLFKPVGRPQYLVR